MSHMKGIAAASLTDLGARLRPLATLPDWLQVVLNGSQVQQALIRHVPDFASGQLRLISCSIRRLVLKDARGQWEGTYTLIVEDREGGPQRAIAIRAVLNAPSHSDLPEEEEGTHPAAFGTPGWSCTLPELRLRCQAEPPEQALPAMAVLADPLASRGVLEQSIRDNSSAYQLFRIATCTPQVLSYKPGSRCIFRFSLAFAPGADDDWPATLIAKAYRNHKGKHAYNGMVSLWHSPLAASDVVQIAEPLAYISNLRVLVQRPVPQETTLEELLQSALEADTLVAQASLEQHLQQAAAGLAALHQCGVQTAEMISWEQRMAEIPELADRLAVAVPELTGIVAPLLAKLHEIAAAQPAEPTVPTHGTFSPEQVLIAQDRISFIDFDNFCMAEPALDVGRFCAALMDSGLHIMRRRAVDDTQRQAMLARLDALRAIFISSYAEYGPLSRTRVALWEARDYLRDVLHGWIKAKPATLDTELLILQHHLAGMDLLPRASPNHSAG